MLKELCADVAHWMAGRHTTCGRFWADVEEWLTTSFRWRSIRNRDRRPDEDPAEHFATDPDQHDPMRRP